MPATLTIVVMSCSTLINSDVRHNCTPKLDHPPVIEQFDNLKDCMEVGQVLMQELQKGGYQKQRKQQTSMTCTKHKARKQK